MANYTISTTDPLHDVALTAKLTEYNANNPQNVLKDEQAFLSWLMESQFNQWAETTRNSQISAAVQAALAGSPLQLATIAADLAADAAARKAAEAQEAAMVANDAKSVVSAMIP